MKLSILHDTKYHFSEEVFLEPHQIKLKPQALVYQSLERFELNINPRPIGISEQRDEFGNMISFVWFNNLTEHFQISSSSIIEFQSFNPFNFLIYPSESLRWPFEYGERQRQSLNAYLKAEEISTELESFGNSLMNEVERDSFQFLIRLTQMIQQQHEVVYRAMGEPHSANQTFLLKNGSCRDLSWMQINLLRHLGFASRFVSGYFYIPDLGAEHELHAWIEVYLPGAGWIGFDPSHGLVVGERHIPVAVGAHYLDTMAVSGVLRGAAKSDLETLVKIEEVNKMKTGK